MTRNPFLDPDKEIQQGKSDSDILARWNELNEERARYHAGGGGEHPEVRGYLERLEEILNEGPQAIHISKPRLRVAESGFITPEVFAAIGRAMKKTEREREIEDLVRKIAEKAESKKTKDVLKGYGFDISTGGETRR